MAKTQLDVLLEDNHLLIINKKPGDLAQGDKTGDESILDKAERYIARKYNKPGKAYVGLPHRLDRPTSGVVVLCRTSKALERMNTIFKNRTVKKKYWAVVDREPKEHQATLTDYLRKDEKKNKSFAYAHEVPNSSEARLKYKLIKSLDRYYLLEVTLETGRHHQIRAQLANMGCHIKGDVKYGARRANQDLSIHLHARSIEFSHPVTKEKILVVAPPPKDSIWNACLKKTPKVEE